MNMIPEEKFVRDVAYVLRRIQECALYTTTGEPTHYEVDYFRLRGKHEPSARDEIVILEKLVELGVLAVKERPFSTFKPILRDHTMNRAQFLDLELKQPKFKEVGGILERGIKERTDPAKLWEMVQEQARSEGTTDAFAKPASKPHTTVEDHIGYFKFRKQGEKIKIGRDDTRKFKLLQCLCDPHFGITKTIESVFEVIRIPKDDKNQKLRGTYDARQEMLDIIDTTIGELQKIPQLQNGRVRFCFDEVKRTMWLA